MKTPALDAWRQELAVGTRTRATFDELWEAASAEALALEAERDGLRALAESYRDRARRTIEAAARRGAAP